VRIGNRESRAVALERDQYGVAIITVANRTVTALSQAMVAEVGELVDELARAVGAARATELCITGH
jgi:enoyl-CoA hydratase/carnithine racemase